MFNNYRPSHYAYFYTIALLIVLSLACAGTTLTPKPYTEVVSPERTNPVIPPTDTSKSNLINPGTYIIGTDIKSGYYKGNAGNGFMETCYWARLKDLSGSVESILANDNSIGQFYIHIKETDYALETKCKVTFLESLPAPINEFPQDLIPGTYLVGIDIQLGTYKGQAGTDITDACYWARLNDVSEDINSIITNDNAIGQFYVQVLQKDFALTTKCHLKRVVD
jgi:hypothetical protein